MMRIFLILFLFLPFFGNAQNSKSNERIASVSTYTVCNPDSSGVFFLKYNDVYNVYGFYKVTRMFYYYNSNNKHSYGYSQDATMNPNDTIWTNYLKWTNSYDSNNNLIDSISQIWQGSYWSDTINRTQHLYDANNRLISSSNKLKNSLWVDVDRRLYSYTSYGFLEYSIFQNWYGIENRWFSIDSLRYVYDVGNRVTNKYYYRNISTPVIWNNYGKDTTHYNSLNQPIYLLKKRDSGGGPWSFAKEIVWTYDSNDRILSRVTNQYNDSDNFWESESHDYYAYDIYGRQILQSAGGSLYYSNCVIAGINEKNKEYDFSISPNPSSSTLSITSTVDYSSIKIINSIGQTVTSFEDKPTTISVADLSNGIYFIQLLDKKGNLLKTEKFIKE